MGNTLRVYISSTYIDLIPERKVAHQAVLRAGWQPVGMEGDVAQDARPLDVCREKVKSCDIYIGIIAWRYGFIPNGESKSITELEYDTANEADIPKLIFLRSERDIPNASWVENTPALRAFRERDAETIYKREFTTTEELDNEVYAALVEHQKRSGLLQLNPISAGVPTEGVPPHRLDSLLSLLNRQNQDFRIRSVSTEGNERPLVFVIHGDEAQKPEQYLGRVREWTLQRRFNSNPYPLAPEWPGGDFSGPAEEDFNTRMTFNLLDKHAEETGEEPEIDPEAMANPEQLGRYLGTFSDALFEDRDLVMVSITVWSEELRMGYQEALNRFCSYWERWPPLRSGHRLFVFLVIIYPDRKPDMGISSLVSRLFRGHFKQSAVDAQLSAYLQEQEAAAGIGHAKVLQRLSCITRQHCTEWLKLRDIRRQVRDLNRVQEQINHYFRQVAQDKCLTMRELDPMLKQWLTS